KKIRDGFEYMLEKSHQQFAGLKEFTPLGTRPWQDYFKKTFETYTRIWRYQQQYRAVLERSDNFGLKRWQIGEIASKIGQLYYHYYLRTSETNYLLESYIFYYAIRERAYFRDITDAKNPALLVKKIRFYARFIVACVLLNDDELALQLLTESQAMIDQYSRKFRPVDSKEWQLVMQEISTFLEAERKVIPRSPTGQLLSVPLRASEPPVSPKEPPRFHLQEAVLVGGYSSQFKFSELTVDVYRMTQALEFEPSQSIIMTSNQPSDIFSDPPNHGAAKEVGALRHVNPHKHLLFRPTYSNLMQNISQAFKDTSDQTALLLYLSAPGVKVTKPDAALENGFVGGIATRSSKSSSDKPGDGSDVAQVSNCLHPADLIPFTRKSMFLIVESTNSVVFKNIPRIFNQPFICLMSPTESSQKDTHQLGNLFTLFLHSPALGLASLTGVNRQEPAAWKSALDAVEAIQQHIYTLLTDAVTDKGIKKFLSDHLLRQLIIRFVFCRFVLTHHQHHTNPTLLPSSSPELPEDIFNSSTLADKVRAAIVALLVQDQFPSLFTVTEPSNHESLSPEPTSAQPAAPQGQSESMEIDSVVTPTETA
ncbi:protein SCAI, partial [Dimargaris cristalligena]